MTSEERSAEHTPPPGPDSLKGTAQNLRPSNVPTRSLDELSSALEEWGYAARAEGATTVVVAGISMDSREVQSGDLYVALPGANVHGADFSEAAVRLGAAAILTDEPGLARMRALGVQLPVLIVDRVRDVVGPLAAHIYSSQPASAEDQRLFAVTGTNGKTTTTYMVNSVLSELGHLTGLIGTIEILAGGTAIPSKLTTPESTHVHSLVTVMREQGITAASMEVSSHALDYKRVDGLVYDVAGFTNLTQDHLDLHGTMEAYASSKAQLFTPEHSRRSVVTIDDAWGLWMADSARQAQGDGSVVTLSTGFGRGNTAGSEGPDADWTVESVEPAGIGHRFTLRHRDGREIRTATGLPADFNVSNAALAAVMVAESGVDFDRLRDVLATEDALTPLVPGRMQVLSQEPVAIVDFAHNPDALERALDAIRPNDEAHGQVIVVFGATGQRDQTKRPIMGAIAARHADVVLVTDDDPHHEAPGPIREAVEAGARDAMKDGARASSVENIAPRSAAIARAVEIAGPQDSILVAGRGHETSQDVAGVDHALDDREELRQALATRRAREEATGGQS
ncbi:MULTISPECIES: UDP-N-acetylmuramoyl-L-alanyl-D-glutamate--2,6-diaminopimelate ligase [Kocuria]|uniref:UDP-N-acetylmuramoyl-L-alanyl-D-glutamate--2, 6-diaminopimelate ligase n=1 Tax=Kocuria TaxID=57493 RepID=UPI00066024A0|nr:MULTISPECIES: UDP-N-acetylmuramoyl-L-alanyl-D-glutamate--2,6-diaminopimelate ligase [Kocuria]RUQ20481.1 UDP-N-acetylmuramoyl-L-alanyl-D-glutamate--2,6-diaminopimelate ligase [Kocuria sp. HSID16901]